MGMLKKVGGGLFIFWAIIRFIPDQLESIEATAKYAKWAYEHFSAPRSNLLTALLAAIGVGLIFSEAIQDWVSQTFFAPGLTGTADLMLQELDISDIRIMNRGDSYEVDLAVFVRMEIASMDKVRTVQRFELEMVAPDLTQYDAHSEYDVGAYDYVHDVTTKDGWGIEKTNRVREPMDDLAARARTPIQPNTHVARAWVRFKIPHVKGGHQPEHCRDIHIFAVDPSGKRHKVDTSSMKIVPIEVRGDYAVVREGHVL